METLYVANVGELVSALREAGDGDTIALAPGVYRLQHAMVITKCLCFQGANFGVSGASRQRGPETVIDWRFGKAVELDANIDVTFDGLLFTGDCVLREDAHTVGIVTFVNNVFEQVSGSDGAGEFRLARMDHLVFSDNAITQVPERDEPADACHSAPIADQTKPVAHLLGSKTTRNGFDEAVFPRVRSQYEITVTGSAVTVFCADEGASTLTDIEVLSFLDSVIDLTARVRVVEIDGRLRGTCTTLQEALALAANGDRIEAAAGDYSGDLYIDKDIALVGANAGLDGTSLMRRAETAIDGSVVIGFDTARVLIDGVAIGGSVSTEQAGGAIDFFTLRYSVIDGTGRESAVLLPNGCGTVIANNLILGGTEEAIFVPHGFDALNIACNRIEASHDTAAIALNAGSNVDSINISGNTIVGGDYGVLIEVDSGLEQPGDSIVISGNVFGERLGGSVREAPSVAAVCADAPVPASLYASLGESLPLNTYHVRGPAVPVDVAFSLPRAGQPAGALAQIHP